MSEINSQAMVDKDISGLINAVNVTSEDELSSAQYSISVLLQNVLAQNSGENNPGYSNLYDILFGAYDENGLALGTFPIGEQSIIGYLDETKENWEKQFYGIFAIIGTMNEDGFLNYVWDPKTSTSREYRIEYEGGAVEDIIKGQYLGSFFNADEVAKYVLIKNENYGVSDNPSSAYEYRLLNDAEIAAYTISTTPSISMMQQQVLANNYWNMAVEEKFTDAMTVAIANKADIAAIFTSLNKEV